MQKSERVAYRTSSYRRKELQQDELIGIRLQDADLHSALL